MKLTIYEKNTCRKCESKQRIEYQRKRYASDEVFREKEKQRQRELLEKKQKYEVIIDPSGVYDRGNQFPDWDFEESLQDGEVWPTGMIVKRVWDNTLLQVNGTELARLEG